MRRRYDRQGTLAIEPKAFFWMFDPPKEREIQTIGDAAIVEIRGPLDHHSGWWCDSYDAIRERVKDACESTAGHVVLKIDSPGGDVSGCFETARAIRKLCADAGKTLLAYVDGRACSAAYALACTASRILVPETGFVGSVGVISTRIDVTAYDQKEGLRYAITTSGARKADGNPHKPITDGESAATQTIVDSLAEVFFDFVEDMRGLPSEQVAALEAGVFHGAQAVEAGLADEVMSFDELLEAIESGAFAKEKETMKTSKISAARAALEEAAKGEGAEAEKAKRALKALGAEREDEDESAESDEDKPDAEDDEDEAPVETEGDEDEEPASEGDEDEEKAASAGELAAKALAKVNELALRGKRRDRAEVRDFLKSCRWLTAEARELLKDEPLVKVKKLAQSLKPKVAPPAAAAGVIGTRGQGQGGGAETGSGLPPEEERRMQEQMGLVARAPKAVVRGNKQILGELVVADGKGGE